MIKAHEAFVEPVVASELKLFLDREVFRKYQLMDIKHQETAQSAKTLQEAADSSDLDSILIAEFSSFILRFVCDSIDQTLAMSPEPGLVHKFTSAVVALESVDAKSFHISTQLTRAIRTWESGRTSEWHGDPNARPDRRGLVGGGRVFPGKKRALPRPPHEYYMNDVS